MNIFFEQVNISLTGGHFFYQVKMFFEQVKFFLTGEHGGNLYIVISDNISCVVESGENIEHVNFKIFGQMKMCFYIKQFQHSGILNQFSVYRLRRFAICNKMYVHVLHGNVWHFFWAKYEFETSIKINPSLLMKRFGNIKTNPTLLMKRKC